MKKDIDFIRKIKPLFSESAYLNISSREKLVLYSMFYLEKNNINLLFNYICITAFKLFPKRFHFGDFEEYPHIEMLNRTILHLRPKENNYAEGSPRKEYKITKLGYYVISEVEKQLSGEIKVEKSKFTDIDAIKKRTDNDIKKIINSSIYKNWERGLVIKENDIWSFFGVTPYSRIDFIKSEIKDFKNISKSVNNKSLLKFILYIEDRINSLI